MAEPTVRLLRGDERVALARIADPERAYNHVTFPTGIAFGPGVQLVLDAPPNSCQHHFYGYEVDAA